MGAPVGNQNAKNAKRWQQALRRALARGTNASVDAGLDRIADAVVALAFQGERWAVEEVGNREDGKPTNMIAGDADADPILISRVERVVIRANASDTNS